MFILSMSLISKAFAPDSIFGRDRWKVWRLPFFSLCLHLLAQQTGLGRAQSNETRPAKADAAVQVCWNKISSVLGPTSLISTEVIHVAVPQKAVEAALARGLKCGMEALLEEAQSNTNGEKRSPRADHCGEVHRRGADHTLFRHHFMCTTKQGDVTSRSELVDYGIAMAESQACDNTDMEICWIGDQFTFFTLAG